MSSSSSASAHYALLIGINYYADKPLHGSVRDVEAIERYLQSKSTDLYIRKFVASNPENPSSSVPSESPELWPTFENVTSCMREIAILTQPGNWVYIHYCGHGTRVEASSVYSNSGTGDLALDLLDGTNVNKVHYLHGLELAHLLYNMVKKGLKVTVVLDCCFSGSVLRGSHNEVIRFLKYDPAIDTMRPSNINQISGYQLIQGSALRDASMLPNWLINPEGYTILTACGPHEVAEELTFENGEVRGALSYFLLKTIIQLRNQDSKHQGIYHQLCAKFHTYWPRQNPMLYGNKDLSFFGQLKCDLDVDSIPLIRKGGDLYFMAGQAHGIIKDHRYALHNPFKALKGGTVSKADKPIVAKVMNVHGLTSDLVGEDNTDLPEYVQTGWVAKPVCHFSAQKVPIRLLHNIGDLHLKLQCSDSARSLDIYNDDAIDVPILFNITVNDRREFEIQNESFERIVNLPIIPLDQDGAWDKVTSVMEHLTRFKQIEAIENQNPSPSFTNSFSIRVMSSSSSDNSYESKGFLEVEENDMLKLEVRNEGDSCLYVYIFDMTPCWQVKDLVSSGHIALPPKQESNGYSGLLSKKLQMTIPDSLKKVGKEECEDIVKIFVTHQPTFFSILELDKLSISSETLRGTRAVSQNQLSMFFSGMEDFQFRGGVRETLLEQWEAQNFRIRTVATHIA